MNRRILILGSGGQIGAYLTDYLNKIGYEVLEFDIVNGLHHDMTEIPNAELHRQIMRSHFVFFLAFDVGGSHYLKKYQHTFKFIDNNARMMANVFGLLEKYDKPFVFASSQMSNMSYSPYGVMKRVGELYTKSLGGLIVKFWNVYGIEKDMEKAHVITDFISKGFQNGVIEMMTDGKEERQFLYAEDCCKALKIIMKKYDQFKSDDPLHITSFKNSSILEVAEVIQDLFLEEGKQVQIIPSNSTDTVQLDKKNKANTFILGWWQPKTTLRSGIKKIFEEMKNDWV